MNALSSAGGKVTATILRPGSADEPEFDAMSALPRGADIGGAAGQVR
jgi:hypothetical protein